MATYHAIAATSQAIIGVLADACPKPEFDGAQFAVYQASDFQSPMDEGVSLYLYRVALNATLRNLPPRTDPDGRRHRPALPVDLHYMLTAWAKTAVRQQRLLGWCMRTLEDTPILPSRVLNHYGPEADTFRSSETVELVYDPISFQDIVNIWDVFKPNLQLSFSYVARLIAIDSTVSVVEGPPAQTRVFNIAKGPTP